MIPNSNIPELTVSELANSIKKTLEDGFGRVRVRGELSKVKIHTSGHMYSDLKDGDALINLVCWRAQVCKLLTNPEEGLEVICTGRITTYPARSNYQMVVEQIELAGEGALLKMLEDRRKRLTAEGLFDASRKRKLPFLPETIGVVTSPTGAVIRDILHRLDDRFPRHVLVWPVKVQGPGSADEIAAAINGFNALQEDGKIPRPDLLIVARGGGSLEDLMAFNEESVVRAAANSKIPLISAVGHETDTTLIDFASDMRAPTPTAAAEMAVPERINLLLAMEDIEHRLNSCALRGVQSRGQSVSALAAHFKNPQRIFETRAQKLDHASDRLGHCLERQVHHKRNILQASAARLAHPKQRVEQLGLSLQHTGDKLGRNFERRLDLAQTSVTRVSARLLKPQQKMDQAAQNLQFQTGNLTRIKDQIGQKQRQKLDQAAKMLEILSYNNVLKRGFAVVRSAADHQPLTTAAQAKGQDSLDIQFMDGEITVTRK